MSTAPAAPAAHADDDHAHAFDGEPVQTLPDDEPRTPSWLPLLGLLLFVGAGVALLVTGDKPDTSAAKAAPKAPAAQTAQPANALPEVPRPSRPPQAPANPTPVGSEAPLRRLTPEQLQTIQKQLEQEKAKRAQQPPPARPAPAP
jgi:hypothetical protein